MTLIYKPHQIEGAKFLTTLTPAGKPHKVLGDAPGTGKTVTLCRAINDAELFRGFICTEASEMVKIHWKNHLIDWCGFKASDIHIVMEGKQRPPKNGITIGSYELLLNDGLFDHVYNNKYDYMILDEVHRLKGEDAKITKRILGDRAKDERLITQSYWKWGASGSIVMNRPMEIFPITSALAPECLGEYRKQHEFGIRYCNGYFDTDEKRWYYQGASHVEELREQLKPFFLRRELEDVYDDIPEIIEHDVYIDIGDIDFDERNTPPPTLRKEIGKAKLPVVLGFIKDKLKKEPNEKILVFTYSREVSEGVKAGMPQSGLVYGGTPRKSRLDTFNRFIKGDLNPLIMQVKSGGQALDGLQRVCKNVVFAEIDYVPGGYDQQVGRLKRHGQPHPVNVFSVLARATFDENIIWHRRSKQKPIDKLLNNVERASRKALPIITQYAHNLGEIDMGILEEIRDLLVQINDRLSEGNEEAAEQAEAPKKESAGTAKAADKKEKSVSDAKKSATSATVADKKPKLTADDVRAAAAEIIETADGDKEVEKDLAAQIQAIVKKHGAKKGKADELKPEKMALAIADIKALAEENEADEEGGDEDDDLGI
jgi:superfamily II DNA or RNA helicase